MKYTVLVVDDESEIREGIINSMDWSSLGFEVIASAANGFEGLEKAELHQPDLILCDIRMDYMDGLEMCEAIRSNNLWSKIIIMSGFDDFDYAKRAIRLNVSEYIMKPVDSEGLEKSLRRIHEELEKEQEKLSNIESLKEQYKQTLPLLKDYYLIDLISGRFDIRKDLEPLRHLELEILNGNLWVVAQLDINRLKIRSDQQQVMINYSMKQIVERSLKNYCASNSIIYEKTLAIICVIQDKSEISQIMRGLSAVSDFISSKYKTDTHCGLGSIVSTLEDIHKSWREAQVALNYKTVMDDANVIYIGDVEPHHGLDLPFTERDMKQLDNALRTSSPEDVDRYLISLFSSLSKLSLSPNYRRLMSMVLVVAILPVMQSYDIPLEDIFGKNLDEFLYLNSSIPISEIELKVREKCRKLSELIVRKRLSTADQLAQEAKQFIEQNYRNSDISVDMVCSKLHISPAYFSVIIKRLTQQTFISFLTELRMNKAAQLLLDTENKTYVIAEMVGYPEPNYFSYVFKRFFGLSPTAYRKQHVNKN